MCDRISSRRGWRPPTRRKQLGERSGENEQPNDGRISGRPFRSTVRRPANRPVHSPLTNRKNGGNSMSGMAILENVRRSRTIASLYRQTAAFRPAQKWSLLDRAYEYERLAIAELEPITRARVREVWQAAAEVGVGSFADMPTPRRHVCFPLDSVAKVEN